MRFFYHGTAVAPMGGTPVSVAAQPGGARLAWLGALEQVT